MPFVEIFEKPHTLNEKENQIKPLIIIDQREKNSLVPSSLIQNGCNIEFKHLEVGDYIIKDVIVERKTVSDFLSSMINKRLINQLENMKKIENKLLIIEGIQEKDLYNNSFNINENATRGFIISILLNHKIPIIFSKNENDTSKFLAVLAKRNNKEISTNNKRKSQDINQQMQFIIESFPGIGPKNAIKLLNEFSSLKNIINANQEDLEKIIGKKAEIFKITDSKFVQ